MDYEGQICRAPMERGSYMLPVRVGCSYNRCSFCNLFRHVKSRVLPLEEIEKELHRVKCLGGHPKKIFLGDGNAFDLNSDRLFEILEMIDHYFPGQREINADATVTGVLAKMLAEHQDARGRYSYVYGICQDMQKRENDKMVWEK